jgi:hypothetical protein
MAFDRQSGQASVELVALLPLIAALLALAWQLVLAGHAEWAAGAAARAAARAHAVGGDPRAAARGHLPHRLERDLRLKVHPGGTVEVSLPIPAVLAAVRLGRAEASAHFVPQASR